MPLPMDLPKMAPLSASAVCYVVIHTTGTPNGEDTSAEAVNRYHRDHLKWSGIGYHLLIRKDGSVELGRPLEKQGAHVAGLNSCSIGVALSGNHDLHPPTPEQWETAVRLGVMLVRAYDVAVENVIGHREINGLIEAGKVAPKWATPKSCPGVRFNMHKLRKEILVRLIPPTPSIAKPVPVVPEIKKAA